MEKVADKLKKENETLKNSNKNLCKTINELTEENKKQVKAKEAYKKIKNMQSDKINELRKEIKELKKRKELEKNLPDYKLITYDEPIDYWNTNIQKKLIGTNELHILEVKEEEGDNYNNGSPIMMTWDSTNKILDEFFSQHYNIDDIYNYYYLDMTWLNFIKEKWGWKKGEQLKFKTKTNSDGYMNFWKVSEKETFYYMIDENGVFCSKINSTTMGVYCYYEDRILNPINCLYNQNLKLNEDKVQTFKDLRKKPDCLPSDMKDKDEEIKELKQENKKYYEIIKETKKNMGYSVTDSEDEDEDDYNTWYEPSECMSCDKKFCMYNAKYGDQEKAYNKYFGSNQDDGDLCEKCILKVKYNSD
tara:strand:+ start:3527 stop:4606 length:1080 start_codon:yes stop_codon:yes gene_type:complete